VEKTICGVYGNQGLKKNGCSGKQGGKKTKDLLFKTAGIKRKKKWKGRAQCLNKGCSMGKKNQISFSHLALGRSYTRLQVVQGLLAPKARTKGALKCCHARLVRERIHLATDGVSMKGRSSPSSQ